MIAGFADAATALGKPEYAQAASRAAEFVLQNLKTKDGRLLRTYSTPPGGKGEARLNAYLEDYAYLVHGLLSLHEATGQKKWLDEAVALTAKMSELFQDKAGGFFFTSHDHEKLFARAKDQYDGATPSGNSIAALNLVRLASRTGEARYGKQAEETFKAFAAAMKANPSTMTAMARALDLWLDGQTKPDKAKAELFKPGTPGVQEEEPVKLSATVSPEKPSADGRQTITVTLEVGRGWHAYANPAGLDNLIPTTVQVSAKAKLEEVKVDYPPGKKVIDPALEQPVQVYEGKTPIKVNIRRPLLGGKPDDSPLELSIKYQVCNDKLCLPPKTVKLQVPAK
jgi:hypothetical protein